jgi:hypothetical protein
VGTEIEPEYGAAVQQAIKSGDGYQLAMMALAASNMKETSDYTTLMQELNSKFKNTSLNAETSVVNSNGNSLKAETLSLYALALMRETSPNLERIARIISDILSRKNYFGYGSTQATVLALQAIVQYSKLANTSIQKNETEFVLNGRSMKGRQPDSSDYHTGKNDFTVRYSNEKNQLPYSIEVSYNTFTPPGSEGASLKLETNLSGAAATVGETVRLNVEVSNEKDSALPMAIAKIGIPAGLSLQPWQLKELTENKEVAYYEIFDNYLVLYWMGFDKKETKKLFLDLKAEIPGTYLGKASNVYLYYTPEYRHWNEGLGIEIKK